MNKNKLLIGTIILIIVFLIPCQVFANEDLIEEQLHNIDTSDLDSFLKELNTEYDGYMPKFDLEDILASFKGSQKHNMKEFGQGLLLYSFREISANYNFLGKLIALSIICAILKNIQSAFENDNISKVAYSVIYLVLTVITIQSFAMALNVGRKAIEQMVSFVQALVPIIFTILASLGGITSITVFNPLIFVGVTVASTWIKDILLPVILFIAVLGLVNSISDKFHVSFLASFLKQICVFLLGLFMSVFLGIVVVQGAASATIDGISVRTAKFASKNFIPIVGGIFSDTVDTIVGCSLILKNAIGLTGLLIIFILTIFPVIKILSIIFIYKLAGAIIQPLGEDAIVKCLNEIGNSLSLIFVSVASVALMFFVAITVMIAAGNISVMLR